MFIIIGLIENENRLILCVKSGNIEDIKEIVLNMGNVFNSLLDFKNYCIGLNAILKKVSEMSGVRVGDLNSCSHRLLDKIHNNATLENQGELICEISEVYCNAVLRHRKQHYSTPVVKAIVKIENDIKGDLSLKRLSNLNNISAGYFSALFKKEVGTTLTDYVNQKRMEYSRHLLLNTGLTIREIGNNIGIKDQNYFIKLFKRYIGVTPKEYRSRINSSEEI